MLCLSVLRKRKRAFGQKARKIMDKIRIFKEFALKHIPFLEDKEDDNNRNCHHRED